MHVGQEGFRENTKAIIQARQRIEKGYVALQWGDPESWAMFYILYHSAEMKGSIPKLNVVSKTLEGFTCII